MLYPFIVTMAGALVGLFVLGTLVWATQTEGVTFTDEETESKRKGSLVRLTHATSDEFKLP